MPEPSVVSLHAVILLYDVFLQNTVFSELCFITRPMVSCVYVYFHCDFMSQSCTEGGLLVGVSRHAFAASGSSIFLRIFRIVMPPIPRVGSIER